MYSNEHTLQDLLRKVYHRLDMDDVATEIEVRQAYHRVVGELISRLTWSVKYKEGTLSVRIASPALKQELMFKREGLMERINTSLNRNAVKKINLY